jgi:hypothetical protein
MRGRVPRMLDRFRGEYVELKPSGRIVYCTQLRIVHLELAANLLLDPPGQRDNQVGASIRHAFERDLERCPHPPAIAAAQRASFR